MVLLSLVDYSKSQACSLLAHLYEMWMWKCVPLVWLAAVYFEQCLMYSKSSGSSVGVNDVALVSEKRPA